MTNKVYIQRNKRGQYLVSGKLVSKPYVYRSLSDNKVYQINPNGTRNLLSKPQPDIYKELWKTENPQKANYNNGKGYKYKDPKGWYIGPGFDYKLHGTEDFKQKVENGIGVSNYELNQQLANYKNEVLSDVDKSLEQYTNFPDTISPQIKMGLIDVYWQSGRTGFKDWSRNKRLQKAAAEGNLEKIKENGVSYINGKLDTRRNNERIKKFWYYSLGGILKFQSPSQPISRATDEYYNGTGWHFVKGNQLKPSELVSFTRVVGCWELHGFVFKCFTCSHRHRLTALSDCSLMISGLRSAVILLISSHGSFFFVEQFVYIRKWIFTKFTTR